MQVHTTTSLDNTQQLFSSPTMSKSSLSSVVSNLVRVSMGSSLPSNVPDDDLDRHVAEIILKEAKEKGERYNTQGIKAYLNHGMSDNNVPKTNKRFLSSIIRSTDDHNKTLLRAQALAAQEIKREKDEQERKEKRARAEEAVAAARRLKKSDSCRWDGAIRSDRKRKERSWEEREDLDNAGSSNERRQSSRRPRLRHQHRSHSCERGDESRGSRRTHRGMDEALTPSSRRERRRSESRTRGRSRSKSSTPDPQCTQRSSRHSSPKPTSSSRRSPCLTTNSQSIFPSSPPHQLLSKMDRYFEESYDPRLDIAPLSVPNVPATGLIDNAEFEGWDAMLEVVRIRREDKAEKKMLERKMGIRKDKKDKKGKSTELGIVNDRWREDSENIMEIEYKKKGSVREWDMGKEGF